MKVIIFIALVFSMACQSNSDKLEVKNTKVNIEQDSSSHDSTLAIQYGADKYGMKPYIMAFLKTGPNTAKDSTHAAELQSAHMANIGRLAKEGKLVLAGPFYGEAKGDFRGIYLFNTDNLDSAKAYTATDPAIKWGSLKMELINFYGSAALMGVNEVHDKIAKIKL